MKLPCFFSVSEHILVGERKIHLLCIVSRDRTANFLSVNLQSFVQSILSSQFTHFYAKFVRSKGSFHNFFLLSQKHLKPMFTSSSRVPFNQNEISHGQSIFLCEKFKGFPCKRPRSSRTEETVKKGHT